jgi:glutamate racemase
MKEFFKKNKVTILITDSGYGGLSVCADIEKKFHSYFAFKDVRLVFYNSQPKSDLGYNKMKSKERKIKVFNNALHGMIKWYKPDIILIACNTLSVLYPETEFSKNSEIPVIGIVDFGVDMIYEKMKNDENTSVIIYGTETTIAANSHKNKLISRGIDSIRIITQPCKDLAGKIESDSRSEAVKNLINTYVTEAVKNLTNIKNKVLIGLCCTHYGYCSDIFYNAHIINNIKNIEIADPNSRMSDSIFVQEFQNKFKSTNVTVEVVSRVKIQPEEMNSIGGLIKKISVKTAKALNNYKFKEDLFKVE